MALRRAQLAVFNNFLKLSSQVSHLPNSHAESLLWCSSSKCNTFHTSSIVFAGHSKWQNIKHIKAAQDKIKSMNASILTRKLQVCLNHNPNTDPKLNTGLASLMKWAKSKNIPNELITRTIERAKQMKDPKNLTTFDALGPENTAIIIEAFSPNPKHTSHLLQAVLKKGGFSLHNSGIEFFDHKGYIDVDIPEEDLASAESDPENFNIDKYIDVAIETGAEDVTLEMGDEKPHLTFVCGPLNVTKVQKALEETGHGILSAERMYTPTTPVVVTQDFFESVGNMVEKMEELPEVVKYFVNFVPEEAENSS